MSKSTTYYSLVKPEETEKYDVNVMNANLDTIDTNLKSTNDKFGSYLPLNANATSATKATQDGDGNNISSTYIKSNVINRICIGSQTILTNYNFSFSEAGSVQVTGAYDYGLIAGIFNGVTIPSGYHKEYRMTMQFTNGNGSYISANINGGVSTAGNCTYSNSSFRIITSSPFFKESDIALQTTMNYSRNGTNLYIAASAASSGTVFSVTIHGYLVKD